MPSVNFIGYGAAEVSRCTTILEAARSVGVAIESPCGGVGVCGKCKVRVDTRDMGGVESPVNRFLPETERALGYVLACEAKVLGDITVFRENQEDNASLQILSSGKEIKLNLNPYIAKRYDDVSGTTSVYGGEDLLSREDGNTVSANYGLSLDIGTTTLVLTLINLNGGEELGSASALNPQAVYAQDVLSRIKFASEEDGLRFMRNVLTEEINRMIGELASRSGIDTENIYEIVYSGNTCMLHLATGVSPESLGRYPYTPAIRGAQSVDSAALGINMSKRGIVYLPPIISPYVGADITSGLLAVSLFERRGVTLFVDIGTNGEMALGVNGKVFAASTAAGPAFEGMNISYGMRAGAGAIERVEISDGKITTKVICGGAPVGICGSGLVDAAGELVVNGIIGKNGRFSPPENTAFPLNFIKTENGKTAFRLVGDVSLSQNDIRQIQLAKGAIRAGIEFLLKEHRIKPEDVDSVLIAGSFGYHLRAESLINIGLLQKEFRGKIEFVGNTSGTGGKAFLLDCRHRKEMEEKVKTVSSLELANMPDFDRLFVKCLNFCQISTPQNS